jgi:glycosyltransferase involved in cell wall biosynthesis
MLIGIDASRAVAKHKTGTEHYSEQIIYHISKIDNKNQYILFSESPPLKNSLIANLPKNFTWKIIPFGYLWTQLRLSWEMIKWKNKIDVLFVPAHTIPLIHPQKVVVTIHDLGFEYFPKLYAKKPIGPDNPIIKTIFNLGARMITLGQFGNSEYDYHRWAMRHAVKNATKIISISKFTKQDIINKYKAKSKDINIIYHGFDTKIHKPLKKSTNIKKSLHITKKYKPYIYYIGRIERKKNILNLLKAYILLKKNNQIPHKLVMAGMPGLGYNDIKQFINSLSPKLQKEIIQLGYTSSENAQYFMQNASVFAFPTLFEGFGMPILEAYISEIPVVCSNTTACPEIAGKCAIKINPHNANDIARGILQTINLPKNTKRLIQCGKKRVKKFSWNEAAKRTLETIINSTNKNNLV